MMNLLFRPDMDAGEVFVNLNQNATSLAVGTKSGYTLYGLSSADNTLDKIYSSSEEIYLVERLFESSLLAIVTQRAPRSLKVCHFMRESEICNYSYPNSILAVKLNRERLVVCLEESLHIHNIQDMNVVHTIRDTPCNSAGVMALSYNLDHCYLAYPGSVTSGEVQIFDVIHLHAKTMIPAHDSPLAAMAFSKTGVEIATASERGTVIRVFSSLNGTKLFELRRGLKRCVSIVSLNFSACDEYLVSSSNTETVHIFRLDRRANTESNDPKQGSDDWMGYLSKTVSSYLPTQVTDVFTQGRAFTSVTLPEAGIRRICGITELQKQLRLLIASQDGFLSVYSIPSVEGAECQLIKKHDLRLDDCYPVDVGVNSSSSLGAAAASSDGAAAATVAGTTTNPSPASTGGGTTSSNEEAKSSSSSNSYAAAVKTEGGSNASS